MGLLGAAQGLLGRRRRGRRVRGGRAPRHAMPRHATSRPVTSPAGLVHAPGGVRLGAPALTTRGFKEADFVAVAGFLDRAVKIAAGVQASAGKKLRDFLPALGEGEAAAALKQLRADVNAYATRFAIPGFDIGSMVHKGLE